MRTSTVDIPKEAMNLEEIKEEYIGEFGRRKGKVGIICVAISTLKEIIKKKNHVAKNGNRPSIC